jgi:hypothetical protein
MSAETSEAITIRVPHTRREHAEATPRAPRPFAGGGSRLPPNLVDEMLAAGDGYDPRLAYALSVIAGWSYSDADTLANKLKYYELPKAVVDAVTVINPAMLIVASAFLVRSECGRLGVLAFRGTEPANAINWLTDTDVVQRPFGKGLVHQGFYANLQALWEEISAKLDEATQEPPPRLDGRQLAPLERLYVTGHSLGGAMAVLAAAKLAVHDDPEVQALMHSVYTFGQPAVGNLDFVKECDASFGDRLYRHVYAYDVVPRLPPVWGDRFVHFGTEYVTWSASKPWTKADPPGESARWIVSAAASCATSFVTRRLPLLEHLPLPFSIDDHSPTRYIEASRAALI